LKIFKGLLGVKIDIFMLTARWSVWFECD